VGLEQVVFGAFRVDRRLRLLWYDGEAVELGQRACDMLCALVAAKGALVSKDALMAEVWPGQIVEENALQAQISLLRKALGEAGHRYIITVPRRGYRLVVEGAAAEEKAVAEEAATSGPIAGSKPGGQPVIAVMPFINLSGDPADEWLADGLAEDIIIELSRSHWFLVISRSSSFTFKGRPIDVRQVGQDLGVRYIVEGSIRRSGERLRVASQLTETEQRVNVWTERYDRALTDLFAIQDEITHAVSRAIEPAMESAEISRLIRKRPDSLDAWEAWQRAKAHWDAREWESAELLLSRSIMLDPRFAPPHSERALHLWAAATAEWLPIRETRAKAEAEAREAIRLDPADAVGHAMLSMCKGGVRDTVGAVQIAERAVELGPSVWLARCAMIVAQMGARRFDEAALHLEVLHQIVPRGGNRRKTIELRALLHFLRGEYDIAASVAEGVIAAQPDYPHAYWMLLASLGHLGRRDRTEILMSRWHGVAPRLSAQLAELGVSWLSLEDSNRVLQGLRAAGWDGDRRLAILTVGHENTTPLIRLG
jgi:TolB-like protein